MMPFSTLWAALFFIMIVFLGLDSQVYKHTHTHTLLLQLPSRSYFQTVTYNFRSFLSHQFVCVESLVTAIVDMHPTLFRRKHRRELFLLGVSLVSFFMGLIMLTEVGLTQGHNTHTHTHTMRRSVDMYSPSLNISMEFFKTGSTCNSFKVVHDSIDTLVLVICIIIPIIALICQRSEENTF